MALFLFFIFLSSPVAFSSRPHLLTGWSKSQIAYLDAFKEQKNTATTADSAASSPLIRVMIPEAVAAQYGSGCLDGSPYGYYLGISDTNSSKWIFHMQGGGLCVEGIDCSHRLKTDLGSSKNWASTKNIGTDGMEDILKSDKEINPRFHAYNHVFLPYCTGDTWTGNRTSKTLFGFHFFGHRNLRATVAHLNASASLTEATHVLVSG